MSDHTDADLLDLAVATAAEAAALVLRMRQEGVDVTGTKSSPIDVVTAADQAAEELVRTRLLTARPDDGFLGEEGHDSTGTSGVRWVVDPIDGTVNYLYGLPEYAVCVAAERDGVVVAGVVHAPALGAVWTAVRGGGSFHNGHRLAVRAPVEMAQRLISTGFNYRREVRTLQAGYVQRLLPQVRDVRRRGSCALDLCSVADGSSDGYVEEGTNPWDDAAASLVATEAGARFEVHTSPSGNRVSVASPDAGFDEFLSVLTNCGFLGNR
ncbi:MAG: inositol-phosphate phosphatase [Nocardioidaceae bacterium]|nr:inositol-phosphate phosphatase [Nocardioidaceae bacterium]